MFQKNSDDTKTVSVGFLMITTTIALMVGLILGYSARFCFERKSLTFEELLVESERQLENRQTQEVHQSIGNRLEDPLLTNNELLIRDQ
eukprot:UN14701